MPRLKKYYLQTVVDELRSKLGYSNPMEVPRIRKIVINMGVGAAAADQKKINSAVDEMRLIAGQQPVVTYAKKSIAGFKVREDMKLGCKVTLRGDRMYEFFDRLVTIALPRVRDFRGLNPKSFDGRGNYSFGIKEQIIFPEIDYDKVDQIRGLDVCIETTAKTNSEGRHLLESMGLPFVKTN